LLSYPVTANPVKTDLPKANRPFKAEIGIPWGRGESTMRRYQRGAVLRIVQHASE